MPTKHTDEAVSAWLENNPAWTRSGDLIQQEYKFKNFVQAIEFVNSVAELAETIFHHPDIDIRYNRVKIGLTTHDVGGLSDSDTMMAEAIDSLRSD